MLLVHQWSASQPPGELESLAQYHLLQEISFVLHYFPCFCSKGWRQLLHLMGLQEPGIFFEYWTGLSMKWPLPAVFSRMESWTFAFHLTAPYSHCCLVAARVKQPSRQLFSSLLSLAQGTPAPTKPVSKSDNRSYAAANPCTASREW